MCTLLAVMLNRGPGMLAGRLLRSKNLNMRTNQSPGGGNGGSRRQDVKREARFSLRGTVKCTGSSILAGILASLITVGLGSKVVLVILELLTGMRLNLSPEGDAALLIFSAVFGALGALIFALVGPFIPGSRAARGGYFGVILFMVMLPMLPESLQEDALMMESHLHVAIALFGLILMGFGALLEPLQRLLSRQKSG